MSWYNGMVFFFFWLDPGEEQRKSKFVEEKKNVDIGFPAHRISRSQETDLRLAHHKHLKEHPELEVKSRKLQCRLNSYSHNGQLNRRLLLI